MESVLHSQHERAVAVAVVLVMVVVVLVREMVVVPPWHRRTFPEQPAMRCHYPTRLPRTPASPQRRGTHGGERTGGQGTGSEHGPVVPLAVLDDHALFGEQLAALIGEGMQSVMLLVELFCFAPRGSRSASSGQSGSVDGRRME